MAHEARRGKRKKKNGRGMEEGVEGEETGKVVGWEMEAKKGVKGNREAGERESEGRRRGGGNGGE